jgi:nickel/cobalt transporter (NicO) family protein
VGGSLPLVVSMFLLGMLHGLEPGHGKTVVASYLVGQRGRWRDAVYLGAVAAFSHSAVIIALASLAAALAERFPVAAAVGRCELAAGVLVVALGLLMLRRCLRGAGDHHTCGGCRHHHDQDHRGEPGSACHPEPAAVDLPVIGAAPRGRSSLRDLTALGIAGGLLPCPTAIAALLGATSSGRPALGVGLVLVFSLGLATVLIAVGLAVVTAGDFSRRWLKDGRWTTWIPLATACLVLLLGLGLVARSLLVDSTH